MPKFFKPGQPDSVLDIDEAKAIQFQGGTEQDPFGGLLRSGFQQGDFPKSNILPEVPSVVGSTNQLRQDEAVVKADANNLVGGTSGLNDLLQKDLTTAFEDPGLDEDLVSDLDLAREEVKRIQSGEFTDVEQAGVGRAISEAATPFDEIIREAEETRRQSLARAEIEGGKKTSGVFSSQIQGQGGTIARVKSVFDRNISNLQVRRANAIAKAKATAEKALRTGSTIDLNEAKDAIEDARKATKDAQDLALERIQAINSIKTSQRAQVGATFKAIQDQIDIASGIPEGETQVFKDPFTGEDIEVTGIGTQDVDPFFTGSNIISLMKAIPEGTTETVTDPNTGKVFTLQGMSTTKPNQKTVQATDDAGNVTLTTVDLQTGEILNQAKVGRVGKTKAAPISIVLNQQQTNALEDAKERLESSVGDDGKTNTDVFIAERNDYIKKTGDAKAFDESYSHLLSDRTDDAKAQELRARLDLPKPDDVGGGWTPEAEQQMLQFIDQATIDMAKAANLTPADLLD